MNVIVQSKTMDITEALRRFVTQQARKIGHRGQRVSAVTVFLELVKRKKNDVHASTAKFLVDLPGKQVVVQERAQDLYVAISQAAKASVRQVGRVNERRHAHVSHRLARA